MNIGVFVKRIIGRISPKLLIAVEFYHVFHRRLNWKNPKDINEKINWMKLYGDISTWTRLADKYQVRSYVTECGLSNILTELYGKWDSVEDINWDSLPNQFVLKVNNRCGNVLVCKDKTKLDVEQVKIQYSKLLHKKFGRCNMEPQYEAMSPCIIIEQLLNCEQQSIKTDSMIDYKIWCFEGKPYCILTCYNRQKESLDIATYDLDWNVHPEWTNYTKHYKKSNVLLPKPKSLEKMLEYATILSKGHPQVRVDLYEIEGNIYFGEMTFTSGGGFMNYYTTEFLNELGSQFDILPKTTNRKGYH